MAVYAQFGGSPCDGARSETRSCETTKGCPLKDGCGDRFRCRSGKCISRSLLCNGDQDCEEDGLDELPVTCDIQKHFTCSNSLVPPNIELLGLGFDMVSGNWKASVINTKSFGGQCRTLFSGVHNNLYRLPLSTLRYNFLVKVQNDFSDEMFESKWHYAKDIVNRQRVSGTTTGYRNYNLHERDDRSRTHKLLVLKNDIEVAQFQSNSPEYLPISEEFWKALAKLPSVYDYAAYRKVLEMYGTHYLSEGSLGGSFKVVARIDKESEKKTCSSSSNSVENVIVNGGGTQQIAALVTVDFRNPNKNWEMYSNWADSVRSFPKVTQQKLRPLSELVKEVQCAGVKKLYLRRAIEQYLSESDPCHCRPCSNNGMVVMVGDECKCICKPGTLGLACERGTEAEGQQVKFARHNGTGPQSAIHVSVFDYRFLLRGFCNNGSHLENGTLITFLSPRAPQDPKHIYLVGSKVEYRCTAGFYLVGQTSIECTANQTWSSKPGLCSVSRCQLELADDVIASPLFEAYAIGESVTLSCPPGRQLLGEAEVTCDSSMHFSPNPADIKCSSDQTSQCQCKDSADCVTPGYNVCVRVGDDAANQTMSECNAGLRRCKGEKVSVVSILPCTD
ncbi:Complement component C7 [Nibea albiflora]|uniref:Complement component C7 n=1 Tax=Nibea albiflora TaxID=240163 RepID=A0ACB7FDL9_NIBAL|nr:Complement component C7 [Nibea albiflora]